MSTQSKFSKNVKTKFKIQHKNPTMPIEHMMMMMMMIIMSIRVSSIHDQSSSIISSEHAVILKAHRFDLL